MIDNEHDFQLIRRRLLDQPTVAECKMAFEVAKLNLTGKPSQLEPVRDALKNDRNLIIHYTYEKRLQSLNKDIHSIWHKMFNTTAIFNTRLIVGNRNSRKLSQELIKIG